ncbi:MAG: helix-turn-helix transcriptional regulator [Clostridia bacterium]|nr:helix-turn-helix transcriptional regulator [Clostridia bacterium]
MKSYERLKEIREASGYSIEEIAKLLNATPKQIKKWESGEAKMKLSKYVVLAKLYQLSLDYIAGLIDTPNKLK